jgi:hypothetical protein
MLADSIADFHEDEIRRADPPLRSVAEIMAGVAQALDAALELTPKSLRTTPRFRAENAGGSVETLRWRLAALRSLLADAPAEHFLTKPPPQPQVPFPAPATVGEAVTALGMYFAMLTGEIEIIRNRLGKQKLGSFHP